MASEKISLVRHHAEQLGLADAARPLLAQLGAVVAQVRHQLLQERARVIVLVICRPVVRRLLHFCFWSRSIGLVVHVLLLSSGIGAARGGGLILVHRGRGPRARAPSRNRSVIVAIMSSLPSAGVDMIKATINPMSDSVRRAAAMSPRRSPVA